MNERGSAIEWRPEQVLLLRFMNDCVSRPNNLFNSVGVPRRMGSSTCIAAFAAWCHAPVCVISTCKRSSLRMREATQLFGGYNVQCHVAGHEVIANTKARLIIFDDAAHMSHCLIARAIRDKIAAGTSILYINSGGVVDEEEENKPAAKLYTLCKYQHLSPKRHLPLDSYSRHTTCVFCLLTGLSSSSSTSSLSNAFPTRANHV